MTRVLPVENLRVMLPLPTMSHWWLSPKVTVPIIVLYQVNQSQCDVTWKATPESSIHVWLTSPITSSFVDKMLCKLSNQSYAAAFKQSAIMMRGHAEQKCLEPDAGLRPLASVLPCGSVACHAILHVLHALPCICNSAEDLLQKDSWLPSGGSQEDIASFPKICSEDLFARLHTQEK